MDKFQEKYINLSKDYYKNNGNAASVEALYQFKEELEANEEPQAKHVLVDIYQLLSMQKSAYELLLKIHDKNDKKQLKTLGYLSQFVDEGDKWAVPRPKSKEQILAQKAKAATLPKFRYHPEPLKTGAFKDDMCVICECCGKNTEIYYNNGVSIASKMSPIFAQPVSQMVKLLRNLTLPLCRAPTILSQMTPKKMRNSLKEHQAMRAGKASTGWRAVMIIAHFWAMWARRSLRSLASQTRSLRTTQKGTITTRKWLASYS